MKATENTEKIIIMEIDETINQWFIETQDLMKNQGYFKNASQIDSLCIAALFVLRNYLKNILLILNNGGKLPAKALLRISGEFVTKFLWCIKDSTRKTSDLANKNYNRWLKTSLNQDQTLRNEILNYFKGDKKLLEKINTVQKELGAIKNKGMPSFKDIFKDVFGTTNTIAYGGMYLLFLNSVHIDLRTISDTIAKQDNIISCNGDEIKNNFQELKADCLICAYLFLNGLYNFYELCFKNIEKRYNQLLNFQNNISLCSL